mgnify:CR=1 FL=1
MLEHLERELEALLWICFSARTMFFIFKEKPSSRLIANVKIKQTHETKTIRNFVFEDILFWYSSEFFPIPNSFSSGSRIPRLPLLSLCILLCVPCLHSAVPLPTPSVCRAIPKFRDFRNVPSGAWSRK